MASPQKAYPSSPGQAEWGSSTSMRNNYPQRSPQPLSLEAMRNRNHSLRLASQLPDLRGGYLQKFPPPPPPPRPQIPTSAIVPIMSSPSSSASGNSRHKPPPPLPKRKPDALRRNKNADQARQIQEGVEDISFTKDDIIIAIMGVTGAGKSTFISLLTHEKIEIGHGLQSCTTKVGVYYFMYHGVRIFLVDTPGFDDTNRSDSEVLKDVAFWLAAAYTKKTRLAGIIYLHRISDDRMPGSALRNLRMFNKLCGEDNLGSVVLATTHWSNLKTKARIDEETGEARIKELVGTKDFWGGMVDRGSQVVKHDGTESSALDIVLNIVGRKNRVILDIQRQLIDQSLDLNETDAAQALQSELIAERKRFEKQLRNLKEEMQEAIDENDLRAQREIKKEQAKAEAEIQKTREETKALKTTLAQIAKEKDEQFRKLQEDMAQQRREYQEEIRKTTAALEAEKEQQRRRASQHEKERKDSEEQRAREAEEHQRNMMEMQEQMRSEADAAVRVQIERQQEEQERWYTRHKEEARRAAEIEQARWERQLELEKERQQELERRREEADRRIQEIELEQRKRAWYNPMRWLGGKYR